MFIEHIIQKFSKVSLKQPRMIAEIDSSSTVETVHNLIMGDKNEIVQDVTINYAKH